MQEDYLTVEYTQEEITLMLLTFWRSTLTWKPLDHKFSRRDIMSLIQSSLWSTILLQLLTWQHIEERLAVHRLLGLRISLRFQNHQEVAVLSWMSLSALRRVLDTPNLLMASYLVYKEFLQAMAREIKLLVLLLPRSTLFANLMLLRAQENLLHLKR